MTQLQLLRPETQQPYPQQTVSVAPSGLQGGRGLANRNLQTQYSARGVGYRRAARRIGSKRRVELEWRRSNRNALRVYVGQWVVLERDRIVASAPSLGEAVGQARAHGISSPYVFRVELDDDKDVATFGL